jgi:hypothetical protein
MKKSLCFVYTLLGDILAKFTEMYKKVYKNKG